MEIYGFKEVEVMEIYSFKNVMEPGELCILVDLTDKLL